ncbi:hypothetical protein MMC17_000646 [Xylographa soralifera]|nr:hypothetical protein [Xylographa soralifera]
MSWPSSVEPLHQCQDHRDMLLVEPVENAKSVVMEFSQPVGDASGRAKSAPMISCGGMTPQQEQRQSFLIGEKVSIAGMERKFQTSESISSILGPARRTTESEASFCHLLISPVSPQERANFAINSGQDQRQASPLTASEGASTNLLTLRKIDPTNVLPQGLLEELQESYFDSLHRSFPIVNKNRYLQKLGAMQEKPELICLSYALWTHGAMCCNKHVSEEEMCYRNTRSLLEQAEMKDEGASFLTIEALQASLLIAMYEIKRMFFSRAWISVGRAIRLAQMMKLHLLDRLQLPANSARLSGTEWQPNPSMSSADWLEKEEKRRAFWTAYILDRCINNGQDWPMMLDDVKLVDLPSVDALDATDMQTSMIPPPAGSLHDYLSSPFPPQLALFAQVAVVAALWGHCMKHLNTSRNFGSELLLATDFWARHSEIEKTVLQISAATCTARSDDPNAIFVAMMLHTITIYLHHTAAAYSAQSNVLDQMNLNSDAYCDTAAMEIAESARAFSALDLYSKMNPFAARCLYAAAQVLVQRIKGLRGDARSLDSLHSVLGIMDAWKLHNPLVEVYMKRISLDLEGNEIWDPTLIPY